MKATKKNQATQDKNQKLMGYSQIIGIYEIRNYYRLKCYIYNLINNHQKPNQICGNTMTHCLSLGLFRQISVMFLNVAAKCQTSNIYSNFMNILSDH